MKEIIIAMDSFKGSMTSLEAGNAIKKGNTKTFILHGIYKYIRLVMEERELWRH